MKKVKNVIEVKKVKNVMEVKRVKKVKKVKNLQKNHPGKGLHPLKSSNFFPKKGIGASKILFLQTPT